MNTLRSRDQRFALAALEAIQRRTASQKDLDSGDLKEYRSRAKSVPAMVLQSGLAQTIGFLLSKGQKRAYGDYLADLAQLLECADGATLHRHVIAAALPDYQRLTRNVLAAAGWLKRMAEIEIDASSGSDDPVGNKDSQ